MMGFNAMRFNSVRLLTGVSELDGSVNKAETLQPREVRFVEKIRRQAAFFSEMAMQTHSVFFRWPKPQAKPACAHG